MNAKKACTMSETPPLKKAVKGIGVGDASPVVFSPSKRSHSDFTSVDETLAAETDDEQQPSRKRLKAAREDGAEAVDSQESDEESAGENGKDDENGDEAGDAGDDSVAENAEGNDGSNDDDADEEEEEEEQEDEEQEEEEQEEEQVCVDCGEAPCVFTEHVQGLIQ